MNKKFILLIVIVFSLGWLSSTVYSIYFYYNNTDDNFDYENFPDSYDSKKLEDTQSNDLIDLDKDDDQVNNGNKNVDDDKEGLLERLFTDNEEVAKEKNSPFDWVDMNQIFVYDDEVVIKISNPEWAMFTNTNSMDPVIDSTSNAIEIKPKTSDEIHAGDIVAYESKYKEGVVTHRVVEISEDDEGWYARLKGDNNADMDPGRVRFEQIKRVVVAVIY